MRARRAGVVVAVIVAAVLAVSVAGVVALPVASASTVAVSASGSGSGPCGILARYGTPCVAAYSSTRAMFGDYDGPMYQVTRASDGTARTISPVSAGGYADASAQDAFCAGTTCTITRIYDQASREYRQPSPNDLTVADVNGGGGVADVAADADALPVTIGGHRVYGIQLPPGVGYHDLTAHRTAEGDQPETAYMVASGLNTDQSCCSDFGNTERAEADHGAGHMDAVNLSRRLGRSASGSGTSTSASADSGPRVKADLENGVFAGSPGTAPAGRAETSAFVTAIDDDYGRDTTGSAPPAFQLRGGDARSGGLHTSYRGKLPPNPPGCASTSGAATACGYSPMHTEGGIVLGVGGDNSNRGTGSFFEGAMTASYTSRTDAAQDALQADIVAARYAGLSAGGYPLAAAGGGCLGPTGSPVAGAAVDVVACAPTASGEHWTLDRNGMLLSTGSCLTPAGAGRSEGATLVLADCDFRPGDPDSAAQRWVLRPDGELYDTAARTCLAAQGVGAAPHLEPCTGGSAETWTYPPTPTTAALHDAG